MQAVNFILGAWAGDHRDLLPPTSPIEFFLCLRFDIRSIAIAWGTDLLVNERSQTAMRQPQRILALVP